MLYEKVKMIKYKLNRGLATLLGVSTCVFFKVFQGIFYNFKILVLICVKVGENGIYSEGIYPTTTIYELKGCCW